MRFSPKSEQQIQEDRFPILKPGKYHFEVFEASEAISKKGNPMLVLKLKLLDTSLSSVGFVTDYLMESIAHKLRHACYACGLSKAYDSGEIQAESFLGRSGTLDLGIQKDKSGQYPDKNTVLDYIIGESGTQLLSPQPNNGNYSSSWDDDMPEPPAWVK
jgi:hypothetical protein